MTRDEAFKKLDEALAHGAKNGWSPDWFGGRSSAEAVRVLMTEVERRDYMRDGADVGVTPLMVDHAKVDAPRVTEHDAICVYRSMARVDPFREVETREELQAGLKQAWHIARDGCLVPPDGGSPTSDEFAMCARIANRIRMLMPCPGMIPVILVEGDGAVDPSRRNTPGSAVKISEAEILRSIGASKTGEGEDEDTY